MKLATLFVAVAAAFTANGAHVERRQLPGIDLGSILNSLSIPTLDLPTSLSIPSLSLPSLGLPTGTGTTTTSTTTGTTSSTTAPMITSTTTMTSNGLATTQTVTEYDCECTTTYLTTVTKGKPCTSTIVIHTKSSSTMMAYTDSNGGYSASSSYYSARPTPGYTYSAPSNTPAYTPAVASTSSTCTPVTVTNTVIMTLQMMCTPSTVYQTSTPAYCTSSTSSSYSYNTASANSFAPQVYTTSMSGMQYSPRDNGGCNTCQTVTVTQTDQDQMTTSTYCPPTTYTTTTMACSTSTMSSMTTQTGRAFAAQGAATPVKAVAYHTYVIFFATLTAAFALPYFVMRI